jgi:hypothetical protein
MANLSYDELYKLALSVGMSDPDIMAGIALAESSGNPKAHNPIPPDNSYGLWQVNMLGSMGASRRKSFGILSNDQLYNPATNARAAKKIKDSQGLKAWSTYTNGAYKKHMGKKPAWSHEQSLLEQATGGIGGAVDGAIDTGTAIADGVGVAMDAGEWLSNPSNWVRILYVVGGAALLLGGFQVMARPLINKATDMVPTGKIAKVLK